jgi:hypothetical protein
MTGREMNWISDALAGLLCRQKERFDLELE